MTTSKNVNPRRKALYDGLASRGAYSKSFEEFEKQFSTPEKIQKLHAKLKQDGLYSKELTDFENQFFSDKKKVDTTTPFTGLPESLPEDPLTKNIQASEKLNSSLPEQGFNEQSDKNRVLAELSEDAEAQENFRKLYETNPDAIEGFIKAAPDLLKDLVKNRNKSPEQIREEFNIEQKKLQGVKDFVSGNEDKSQWEDKGRWEDNALTNSASATGAFNRPIVQMASSVPKLAGIATNALERLTNMALGKEMPDIETNRFYKIGKWMDDKALEIGVTATDPRLDDSFLLNDIPSGLGSVASILATGGFGAAKGVATEATKFGVKEAIKQTGKAVTKRPTLASGNMMGVAEFEQAIASGQNEGKSLINYFGGLGAGFTETIPLERALSRINKITGGKLVEIAKAGTVGALEEMTQEGIQQFITNKVAEGTYDPQKDLFQDVWRSMRAGGAIGLLLPGIGVAMRSMTPEQRTETKSVLNQILKDKAQSEGVKVETPDGVLGKEENAQKSTPDEQTNPEGQPVSSQAEQEADNTRAAEQGAGPIGREEPVNSGVGEQIDKAELKNDVNLQNEEGDISNRSPQEERGGGNEENSSSERASGLKEAIGAAKAEFGKGDKEKVTDLDLVDLEKTTTLKYAKENDLWIDDVTSLGESFSSGNENTVYANPEDGVVYKSNNLVNSKNSVSKLLDTVEAHNKLFPSTRYDLVGFTGFENNNRAPYVEVVLKQPYLRDVDHASESEIDNYMQSIGFTKTGEAAYTNGEYNVSDLFPRNVLKDDDGTIYVIDNIIEQSNKDGGAGITPEVDQSVQQNEPVTEGQEIEKPVQQGAPTIRQGETETAAPVLDGNTKESKPKKLLNRAYKGENQVDVKEAIKEYGLTYEPENHVSARKKAKDFIESVGLESAVEAVRNNQIEDGAAAFVWAQAIDSIENEIAKSDNPSEIQALVDLQAELINEFDIKARSGGRFISALQDVYRLSDFNYKASKQIDKYKRNNNGEISKEVEEKFKNLEESLADVSKKLKELEEKNRQITDDANFIRIRDQYLKEKKSRQEYVSNNKKKINDLFDSLKVKNVSGAANDITRVIGASIWNGSVEAMRVATIAGYDIANVIQAGVDYVKQNYNGSDFKESDFVNFVEGKIATTIPKNKKEKSVLTEAGTLVISDSMLKKAIEEGAKDIQELTSIIHKKINNENITERDVRDAISKYGKTKNLSQEEISVKLREFKRVGRLISAIEDAKSKIRPLKTGLQRDKLTDQERRMQSELKELIKDIPVENSTLETQLKSSLDAIKSRLRNQIADLENRIKTGDKKVKKKGVQYDEEANELKAQRDSLKEVIKLTEETEELPLEERINRATSAIQRSIEEYERRIRDKDLEFKTKKEPVSSDAIELLKNHKKELKTTLTKMQEESGVIERKKLSNAKISVKRSIDNYERRIKERDFIKKSKEELKSDDELAELKARKISIKSEFDRLQYLNELKNRTTREKVIDGLIEAWGLTRALRATGEFSFMLIQGGVLTLSHPIDASKAFITAMNHFASSKKHDDWLNKIKTQDYYERAKASKLAITEPDVKLTAREEIFLGGWVNHIWDIAGLPFKLVGKKAYDRWKLVNPVKAVERAGTGYLNTLRLSRYIQGEEMLQIQGKNFKDNFEDYKNVADVINTFSGRASLGAAERIAKPLAVIFFSPRLWASAVKQVTPYAFYHFGKMGSKGDKWYKPSVAQKMAIADYMKYVALTGSVLSLVAIMQDEEEDGWRVELDSRSSDYLKLKRGNTTIDPWGGRQQMIVLQARLLSNSIKNYKGEVKPLGLPNKTPTRMELLMRVVKNKLAPSSSMTVKFLESRNRKIGNEEVRVDAYGRLLTMEDELVNNLYPIYIETVKELHEEQPATVAAFIDFLAFFGVGTQTFDAEKQKKENKELLREIKRRQSDVN
jgi:hypothetical protein